MSVFGVRKEFSDVNTPKTSISASVVFLYKESGARFTKHLKPKIFLSSYSLLNILSLRFCKFHTHCS